MWFGGPKELEREERGEMGEGRAWRVGLMAGGILFWRIDFVLDCWASETRPACISVD